MSSSDAADASSKKRKADNDDVDTKEDTAATKKANTIDYTHMSLIDIQSRIVALCERVPMVDREELEMDHVDSWATQLQAVIEEFNLLVSLVSPATYKWGTDRSGAADQNLGLLQGELQASQEILSSVVTPRLTNVLAPVVDLVVDKTIITTTTDHVKTKQSYYTQHQVDPKFLELCKTILSRNSKLIRQVCLSNFSKVSKAIGDFASAQVKDSQHDSRGFAY